MNWREATEFWVAWADTPAGPVEVVAMTAWAARMSFLEQFPAIKYFDIVCRKVSHEE